MGSRLFVVFLFIVAAGAAPASYLRADFYAKTCPSLSSIVKDVVYKAVAKEARMGASLLRLHFHDCFVNGCDGSVLLEDTPTMKGEKTAYPNENSLRGFEVVDDIKTAVEAKCPGVVSCADILAVASVPSVTALGGPSWTVLLGRRDGIKASWDDANVNMPQAYANLTDLLAISQKKGLDLKDLVALTGAHTIGKVHCETIQQRVLGEPDLKLESNLKTQLENICKYAPNVTVDRSLVVDLDDTPNVFDNTIYKNMMQFKGRKHTDQILFHNASTDSLVKMYSQDSKAFFSDFGKSMIKMGNISPLLGQAGEIRKKCRFVNKAHS